MRSLTETLTLSHAPAVRRLPSDHEFDRVITLGYYDGMGYEKPEASTDEFTFPDGAHDYEDFEQAADAVQGALQDGEDTLVHCQAGASRSPAVCIAALAVQRGDSYEATKDYVEERIGEVVPTEPVAESAQRYVRESRQPTTD